VHWFSELTLKLAQMPAIWITVQQAQGSVPRGEGTVMAVFEDEFLGTIGGGHLEFEAIADARRYLQGSAIEQVLPLEKRFALGPSLGQCCGGALVLKFERVTISDEHRLQDVLAAQALKRFQPVALFGGGHVGKALVKVLAPLPFHVRWIDSRDEIFPNDVAPQVVCEHSNPVHAAVPAACLQRQREQKDLPYIGLIGSATKWATFKRRLAERGFSEAELEQVTCPIGVPGIEGKEPEVIAVAVAAQLLQA
jgi:xanthine dehydrogenase accessory factor